LPISGFAPYIGKGGRIMPLAKEGTYYTYADYLEWDEGIRCEIIEGEALMIAPLPVYTRESAGKYIAG
jgi:hypothetical protein